MSVTFSAATPVIFTIDGEAVLGMDLVEGTDHLDMNVSNVNARHLLETLGFDTDDELIGSATAEDFMGRVLVAMGAAPVDAGVPATQQGNMIDCGRSAGYTDGRLIELETLARCAQTNGGHVSWC